MDGGAGERYAGPLEVGDEILEVDGETVAGLSLDQVTQRLTDSSATVRVLRRRRSPPR